MLPKIIKAGIFDGRSSKQDGFGELSSLEEKAVRLKTELFMKSFEILQGIHDSVPKIISGIENVSGSLAAVLECQQQLEGKLDSLGTSLKMLENNITELSGKTEITDRNLQQTRLLIERVAESASSLSEESIDRYVREPMLDGFYGIYNALMELRGNGNEEIDGLLEQFRQILESNDTEIIQPKMGAFFNPREHQPVKKVETDLIRRDKSVSAVYRVGFKYKGRVIQRALVEVFIYRRSTETTKQTEVENVTGKAS